MDPDHWFHKKPADLDLQCIPKIITPGSAGQVLTSELPQLYCLNLFISVEDFTTQDGVNGHEIVEG